MELESYYRSFRLIQCYLHRAIPFKCSALVVDEYVIVKLREIIQCVPISKPAGEVTLILIPNFFSISIIRLIPILSASYSDKLMIFKH
jgi:hypothetical protein